MSRTDNDTNLPDGWKAVGSSGALYRKFEFDAYSGTSEFLEKLSDLSESTGIYPDLSFASKHVNVTIHAPDEGESDDPQKKFAAEAAALISG